jgi:hypothetical protein
MSVPQKYGLLRPEFTITPGQIVADVFGLAVTVTFLNMSAFF